MDWRAAEDEKDKIDRVLDADFPNKKIRKLNNYGVMVVSPPEGLGIEHGEIIAVFKTLELAQCFREAGVDGLKLELVGCAQWTTPGMFDSPHQLPKPVIEAWRALARKEYEMYYKAGLIGEDI